MDVRVTMAVEIIAHAIEHPPTVKALSERMRLSCSRFQHLFKKETGQALTRFIRATRMARANIMLRDRTRHVKEVAIAVGYPDLSKFSHHFRKQYGESPSRFRNSSPQRY